MWNVNKTDGSFQLSNSIVVIIVDIGLLLSCLLTMEKCCIVCYPGKLSILEYRHSLTCVIGDLSKLALMEAIL